MIALRLFGIKLLAVETGSIGEKYPVGSLLLVSEKESEQIQEGDVISFVENEELLTVTHRVVSVVDNCFYTKGDMNNVIDSPVYFENYIGQGRTFRPKTWLRRYLGAYFPGQGRYCLRTDTYFLGGGVWRNFKSEQRSALLARSKSLQTFATCKGSVSSSEFQWDI